MATTNDRDGVANARTIGRPVSRRAFLAVLAATAGGTVLEACGTRPDAAVAPTTAVGATAGATAPPAAFPTVQPTPAARRGGTITAAVVNDWVSMDPIFNTASWEATFMIYDPLFFYKPDERGIWRPMPGLVEEWGVEENTATFRLRQGVKFHDGSDWDAEVLRFNFERMLRDPKSAAKSALQGVDPTNPVSVVDSHTARINLTRPTPALVASLTSYNTWMVSKAAVERAGPEVHVRNPVGTGPFQFSEWRPSDRVILKRFDGYWMPGADNKALPYLDGITYRLITDDSVRALELQSGNIQFMDLLPSKDIPAVRSSQSLNFLQANWCGNAYLISFNAPSGAFANNIKLRQAALYAMDRETIARTLAQEAGVPLRYMFLPGSLAYDEELPYYSFDVERARGLMREAGLANGTDVGLTVIAREGDKLMAEMLKQMWEAVGIRASIEVLERAAWVQKLTAADAKYDAATLRGSWSADDPDRRVRTHQWSKGAFNVAHWQNQQLDELIDQASGTYDEGARKARYADIQRLDHQEAYYGYIWMQNWNWVSNKRLANVPPPMTSYWDFRSAYLTS